jgi:DNA modification methylase
MIRPGVTGLVSTNQTAAAKYATTTRRTGVLHGDYSPATSLTFGMVPFTPQRSRSLVQNGFSIRAQIIWAKERLVLSRGDYNWQHEPCWYAVRSRGHWTGDRKQTTLWNIPSGNQDATTAHSTQKPVECMRRPMLNNSNPGQAVYDPFLGSGTALIAAETSGRVCLAMELDPHYVDVVIRRWQQFTGKKACLSNDGRSFDVIASERQRDSQSASSGSESSDKQNQKR